MGIVRRPSPQTLAVLRELADQTARWSHGYDLCRSLGLKAGTVYPILLRLAERGLVETAWEQDAPPGRPARHLYRLSVDGVQYLAAHDAGRSTAGARRPAVGARSPRPAGAHPRLGMGHG